jgi:hypothetical protein
MVYLPTIRISQHYRHTSTGYILVLFIGLLALCSPLAACEGTASQALTLTPVNLGLPSSATSAPTIGPLPAATPMQVGVSFKISQTVQDTKSINFNEPTSITGLDEATTRLL